MPDILKTIISIILIVITFAILYTLFFSCSDSWKGLDSENDETLGQKFMNRLYFSMTTLSTVGYGDISPKSNWARLLVMIQMGLVLINVIELVTEGIVSRFGDCVGCPDKTVGTTF